jgi:hypothetical protein
LIQAKASQAACPGLACPPASHHAESPCFSALYKHPPFFEPPSLEYQPCRSRFGRVSSAYGRRFPTANRPGRLLMGGPPSAWRKLHHHRHPLAWTSSISPTLSK